MSKSKQAQQQIPFCVRQGDVLIVDVAYRGDNFSRGELVKSVERVVLAYGEVTGHAHAIPETTKARLLDFQGERYLHVLAETTIRHEEHGPIILREGRFQQAFQVEEQGDEVRAVAD